MYLCLEEMGLDLRVEVAEAQASAEVEEVEVEWEAPALGLVRAGNVSALIAVPRYPIKPVCPATT